MSTARILASAAGVAAGAVVGYFMMKSAKSEGKHPHPPPIQFDNQISETESTKQLHFDDSKVAEPNLSVDMAIDTSSEEKRDRDIVRACRAIYPPFLGSQAHDSEFKVKQIQGGITNQLFRVALGHQCCLFRIYGPKTELIIDRDIENQVMALLTERNFGAAVYGHVRNGRVEQWLPGSSLKPEEMCLDWLMPKIAARLAEMHSMDMPLNREPSLWRVLDKWLAVALSIDFRENPARQQQLEDINLPQVAKELALLKSKLLRVGSPIVFAHNDLLSGNIMYDKASDRVTIIDYEYGAYNYRGFDIANHFCECCGFDCNWDQFPDKQSQFIFMRGYLNQSLGREPSEGELEALYQEVNGFVLAAHMFWGIWAIVQSKHSPVDFDFLSYSALRLNGFKLMKERCYSFLPKD